MAFLLTCIRAKSWASWAKAAAARETWYNVNRLDSTGTGHDYLFCAQDYKEYANKLNDFDNSFDSWMQNGGKRNG